MLTPRFTLSQDDKFVQVSIRVPFARVSETEVEMLDNELHFYSKPYHLRLYFTGDVVEDGMETDYHSTEAIFEIKVAKKVAGTHFHDLEMITKLLTPPGSWNLHSRAIEELDSGFDTPVLEETKLEEKPSNSRFTWQIPQIPAQERNGVIIENGADLHKYGFGLQQHGVFRGLTEELRHVVDIKDIDFLSPETVRTTRLQMELDAFDQDHYLADLFCNDDIPELLTYKPWWTTAKDLFDQDHLSFSENELDVLKELPRQHYHVSPEALVYTWSTLAELIFGYAYDHRTTLGTPTVESSWTVTKLSPSLSCLDSFPSVKEALLACFRRSLIYPLYRHYELSSIILQDVVKIFSLGRRALLKCLLTIRSLCAGTQENRYILNDLYITSYCVWIQAVQESTVLALAQEIGLFTVRKANLDLDLDDTEAAAYLALAETGGVEPADSVVDIEKTMAGLTVDSDDEVD